MRLLLGKFFLTQSPVHIVINIPALNRKDITVMKLAKHTNEQIKTVPIFLLRAKND